MKHESKKEMKEEEIKQEGQQEETILSPAQIAHNIVADVTKEADDKAKQEAEEKAAFAKMSSAERKIAINKKYKAQLDAIKATKIAAIEEAKKLSTTANRGDKNNASYAIRMSFLSSILSDSPKQTLAKIAPIWKDAKQSLCSMLSSDARATLIAFFDLPADVRKQIEDKIASFAPVAAPVADVKQEGQQEAAKAA